MSLYIKGLDMPKDESEEVFIIIKSNGEVRDYHGILLTNAQAVEIPTPHGRLIDGDRLKAKLSNNIDEVLWEIYHAPTILEAED